MNIDSYVAAIDQSEAVLESAIAAEARGDRATSIGQACVAVAALESLREAQVDPDPFIPTARLLIDSLLTEARALLNPVA